MVIVAFYKGPGNLIDFAVRLATKSIFSHVEILRFEQHADYVKCIGYTSSGWNADGITIREISFNPNHWEIVYVDWITEQQVNKFFDQHLGEKYDWPSIFFAHLFKLNLTQPNKWTCSKAIAKILQFQNYHTISPGQLFDLIIRRIDSNITWK